MGLAKWVVGIAVSPARLCFSREEMGVGFIFEVCTFTYIYRVYSGYIKWSLTARDDSPIQEPAASSCFPQSTGRK